MRSTNVGMNAITIICALMIGYQVGVYVQKKRQKMRDIFGKTFYNIIYGDDAKS